MAPPDSLRMLAMCKQVFSHSSLAALGPRAVTCQFINHSPVVQTLTSAAFTERYGEHTASRFFAPLAFGLFCASSIPRSRGRPA